ncbi:hypothetical protein C8A05DRAFT_37799, partial [Staphylotrichum tortipilum]
RPHAPRPRSLPRLPQHPLPRHPPPLRRRPPSPTPPRAPRAAQPRCSRCLTQAILPSPPTVEAGQRRREARAGRLGLRRRRVRDMGVPVGGMWCRIRGGSFMGRRISPSRGSLWVGPGGIGPVGGVVCRWIWGRF